MVDVGLGRFVVASQTKIPGFRRDLADSGVNADG
jgi:hypothetical protein